MIKILQMIGSLDAGGVQAFAFNSSKILQGTEFQFDFAVDHDDCDFYKNPIQDMGSKLYQFPTPTYLNFRRYERKWDAFFSAHREYDIIHGHSRSTASLYLRSAKRHGLATIAHSHNTSNGKGVRSLAKDMMCHSIWKHADIYLACSEEAGSWLYGKHWRHDADSRVIPNAVDLERFRFRKSSRLTIRRELSIDQSAFVIGHVGRFSAVKNHAFLVRCFYYLVQRIPNTVLVLVGDGELRGQIEAQVAKLGLSDNVRFLSNVSDVAPYYSAMDILLFPSLYEGIPLTLIEAQASGLPLVVSSHVNPHAVLCKDNCTILELDSPEKWTDVVVELLNGTALRSEAIPREIANSTYNIQYLRTELADVYRSALAFSEQKKAN